MTHTLSLEALESGTATLDRAEVWDWAVTSFVHDCPEPHRERCHIDQPAGLDRPPVLIDTWEQFSIGPLV